MKKIRVGILYGGRSAEHEVSLESAKNIIAALDKSKYTPVLLKIKKFGAWPSENDIKFLNKVDVVFPILHGIFGEDGTVQGLIKLLDIPCVGAGVLSSAICMDKDVMKRLLRDAGLVVPKFLSYHIAEIENINFTTIKKQLGLPVFVKPANTGSSIGISKVYTSIHFSRALKEAFRFDSKIVIEECIIGREIECSVLGNDKPHSSLPGEVITPQKFYSYSAKYNNEKGVQVIAPAKLTKVQIKDAQNLAIKAFKIVDCKGMARVDMFLTKNNKFVINELNTIPGFTNISMYPKLWAASGIPYSELIDKLIQLAIERHKKEIKLKTKR